MRRRDCLATGGALLFGTATAGCLGLFDGGQASDDAGEPALVEDRPDAVYVPTHVEGMEMAGMGRDGRLRFALSYSFPHRFWLVTGTRTRQVELRDEDSMHLMLSAWDDETGTILPASTATVEITRNGEAVAEKSLWSMLSQNMGVHFGDNVALPEEGTYDVSLSFGPVEARGAGALAGALEGTASASFELDFDQVTLDSLPYEDLPDRQGERDAVDPMEMDMLPSGQLPPADALPGRLLGEGETGDARFAGTALQEAPAGVEGDGPYVAVSARTPYNRFPLPFMSLSVTQRRDGEAVFEGSLGETIHPDLGYHYGATVGAIEAGDELEVRVDAPPQIARHEGYETAFLQMDPVTLTV